MIQPQKNPGISHGIPQIQWHLSFPIQVADRPASPVIGSSARPGATGATGAMKHIFLPSKNGGETTC
jgi:hypothetical protein